MILELNDNNYIENMQSIDKTIFIDFYSPTCGPCQILLPMLEILDSHYKGEVIIAKIDVSKNPKLSNKFSITSVPFCSIIGKDKMVKKVHLGLGDISQYIDMIDFVMKPKISIFSKIKTLFYK